MIAVTTIGQLEAAQTKNGYIPIFELEFTIERDEDSLRVESECHKIMATEEMLLGSGSQSHAKVRTPNKIVCFTIDFARKNEFYSIENCCNPLRWLEFKSGQSLILTAIALGHAVEKSALFGRKSVLPLAVQFGQEFVHPRIIGLLLFDFFLDSTRRSRLQPTF